MKTNDKVQISVIIPCYNDGQYLPELLDSIWFKKSISYEVIIVNDGSTEEKTTDYLQKIQTNYTIINKSNGGPSSARNYGIKSAKGDYILLVDADDVLVSSYFEKAFTMLEENNDIDIIFGDCKYFGNQNKYWKTDWDEFQQLYKNQLSITTLFRKSIWIATGGFDESMNNGYEDWEYWIHAMSKSFNFKYVPGISFKYRIKKESTNTKAIKQHNEILKFIHLKHHDFLIQKYIALNRELHNVKNNRLHLFRFLFRNLLGKRN